LGKFTFQLFLLFPLLCSSSSLLPQTFLAPLNDANVAASDVILSFGDYHHHLNNKFEKEKLGLSPSEYFKDFTSPEEDIISSASEITYDWWKVEIPPSTSEIGNEHADKSIVSSHTGAIDINEFERSDLATLDLNADIDNTLKQDWTDNIMRGSYAYVGADGLPYMIDWVADVDGFHPSAPHEAPSIQSIIIEDELNTPADFGETVEFPFSEDVLSDESSFDEVFSISGNDLPAYGDEVFASQLLENQSLFILN